MYQVSTPNANTKIIKFQREFKRVDKESYIKHLQVSINPLLFFVFFWGGGMGCTPPTLDNFFS